MSFGVTQVGLITQITSACIINKTYRDNGRFNILVGQQYYDQNRGFTFEDELPPHEIDKAYRSRYGPSFWNNFTIYAGNSQNLCLAMYRLMNVREPDNPGLHEELVENQNRMVPTIRLHLIEWFYPFAVFTDYLDNLEEYVKLPHIKRKLRIAALNEIIERNLLFSPSWTQKIEAFLKRIEYAKVGKLPRVVNNLGVIASLQGAEFIQYAKKYFTLHPFIYKNCRAQFIASPSQANLQAAFTDLLYPQHDIELIYFSDDASINIKGQFANTDISSCDCSQYNEVFETLLHMFPSHMQEFVSRIINQLRQKVVLKLPNKKKVVLKPTSPFLASGSILTTIINNIAQLLMFIRYVDLLPTFTGDLHEFIPRAAKTVGYLVTVESCPVPEKLFFLKHFPTLHCNVVQPILGLGVFTRTFGVAKGDYPGKSSWSAAEKAVKFNYELLRNFTSHNHTEIFSQRVMDRYSRQSSTLKYRKVDILQLESHLPYEFDLSSKVVVGFECLMRRYDLPLSALSEFEEFLYSSQPGDLIRCFASDQFLKIDYGMDC